MTSDKLQERRAQSKETLQSTKQGDTPGHKTTTAAAFTTDLQRQSATLAYTLLAHDFPTEVESSTEHSAAKLQGAANHADFWELTPLGWKRKEADHAGVDVFPAILGTQLVYTYMPASFRNTRGRGVGLKMTVRGAHNV